MKLGDNVQIGEREFTVRSFTAAEHERFDEIATGHDLMTKAARLEAVRGARHGTARQKVIEADAARVQAQLTKFFQKDGSLKRGLSEDKRLEAYELATELDMLERKAQALQAEAMEELLIADEEVSRAREATIVEFMRTVLAPKETPADFHASLTDEDVLVLLELVSVGKLRAGLTARDRLQSATLARLLTRGTASGSSQQPPSQAQVA